MSQESLGLALKPQVTRASIANIEAGKQRILTHTLVQLAEVLDVDLSALLPNRNSRPVSPPGHVEAKLAEHNVPRKTIRKLSAQMKASRREKDL